MESCKAVLSFWEEMQRKWRNKVLPTLHLCKRDRKSPRDMRTWAVQMQITQKGERWKMRHKFVAVLHSLMIILQQVQPIPILLCIDHSSIRITPIICSYPICLHSLSHMFLWPMSQKSEKLPIKALLKSSEWMPDCHAWCDTMATQRPTPPPHHNWIVMVLERVTKHKDCGPITVGDTGTQTKINTIVWTTECRGRDREETLGFKSGHWKLGREIHHCIGQNRSVFLLLHTSASHCLCMH